MSTYFKTIVIALSIGSTGPALAQGMADPIHFCMKPEMKTGAFNRQVLQDVNRGDKVKGFLYQTKRSDIDCVRAQLPESGIQIHNVLLKIKGQTSQTYNQKSYNLELVDKDFKSLSKDEQLRFAGLPKGEKFTLTSNYVDRSNMRNPLTYTLASEMGQSRLDTRGKPDLFGTPFVFAEVYFDRAYNGLYTLSARAERNKERVDIAKVDEDHYQNFDWIGEICMGVKEAEYHSKRGTFFRFQYPELKSLDKFQDPAKAQAAKQAMINQLETFEEILTRADFADPTTGYPSVIDVASFVDFVLLEEVTKNVDGFRRSVWFRNIDGKFKMGPVWDFDIAYSNMSLYNMPLRSGWLLDFGQNTWISPGGIERIPAALWFRRLVEDPVFANQLKLRYAELRKPGAPLHDAHIDELIAQFRQTIGDAGRRTAERWKGTHFHPLHVVVFHVPSFDKTYEGNVSILQNWLKDRLAWLDKNIGDIQKRAPLSL